MTGHSTPAQLHRQAPHGDVILAGASVRSLAQSAIRDGLRPICVDMFNDSDLQHWLQQCGLPDNLRSISHFSDVVQQLTDVGPEIPLIPVGGLENDAHLIRQLRQQRPVWLSDESSIQAVRDPGTLFHVLQNHDCIVPAFRQQAPSPGSGRWLKKQLRSAGGMGIRRHNSTSQAPEEASDSHAYWQEWIDGIPLSATFVSLPANQPPSSVTAYSAAEPAMSVRSADASGLQWLGCALQLSGCAELHAPEFQFCGNAGPVQVSAKLQAQIQRTAQTIVRHWPLRGVFGLDFMVRNGSAALLEVNPRPTASHELHEMAADQMPGHVVLHAEAWRDSAFNTSSRFPQFSRRPQVPRDPYVRCVLYAPSDISLTTAAQQQLMEYSLDPPPGTGFARAPWLDVESHGLPHSQVWRTQFATLPDSLPTAWLADLPKAGTVVAAATPFCSIYVAIGRHSVDECHPERDKRTQQILKRLPGDVVSALSKSLGRIREQIAVLQDF